MNVRFGSWQVDFFWQSERVVVEVDGYRYHRTRGDFERDRAKDAWLLSRGFRVLRLSWRQMSDGPMAVAALLAQALVRDRPAPSAGPPGSLALR